MFEICELFKLKFWVHAFSILIKHVNNKIQRKVGQYLRSMKNKFTFVIDIKAD
jgi:hypothetical protein